MKYIELFAGIGGFRLGLDKAGHTCVFTNEWLKKPASIYERNFGDKPDTRDIRTITADDIPDADLIVGGFPCATFSFAGKRTGLSLEDTRGTLFYEMFRLARDKRIPYILFENVKGLLNHDRGETFKVILSVMDEMGYDAEWELLDSQNFGVPQHRERIFVIGYLRGHPRPKVFPITSPDRENAKEDEGKQGKREGLFSNISPTLDAHYIKGGASRQYVVTQWRRGYFRDYKSDGTPTLTANMGTGGHNVPFVKSIDATLGYRKLTPIECERLQGFPDDFTKYYADGRIVSDSERYERCGRTVSVPVIYEIGKKLHEF
jgi:DNA (cytosine-5)-methyltransferase 1